MQSRTNCSLDTKESLLAYAAKERPTRTEHIQTLSTESETFESSGYPIPLLPCCPKHVPRLRTLSTNHHNFDQVIFYALSSP